MQSLEVKRSAIHGRGVFLTRSVKKGEKIAFLKGSIRRKVNKTMKDVLGHPCWVGVGRNTWIDPAPPFRFINHSCDPSASILGKVTIVALRSLQAGEELTLDYSLIEGDPRWSLTCRCGSKKCRKVIGAVTTLHPKIFRQYRVVPTHFKKLYASHIKKNQRA